MSNSPLVVYTKISPNKTVGRKSAIDRITPHCVVGQCSVETLGRIFAPTSRKASSNYGIGPDGRVGMYVEEKDRSWCSSSSANDNRAVTIECASNTKHPYAFKDNVYERLIELCVDICKRNGKTKLLWLGSKDKTLNYKPASNEMVLTVHRWFAAKSCPGDWMYSRMGDLAEKVTAELAKTTEVKNDPVIYRVQVGAYSNEEGAKTMVRKLNAAGFDAIIVKADNKTETNVNNVETPKEVVLNEGDMVRMQKDAPIYGKTDMFFQPWVYDKVLFVRDIAGNRIVVSTVATGAITGAVDKKYLTKI